MCKKHVVDVVCIAYVIIMHVLKDMLQNISIDTLPDGFSKILPPENKWKIGSVFLPQDVYAFPSQASIVNPLLHGTLTPVSRSLVICFVIAGVGTLRELFGILQKLT